FFFFSSRRRHTRLQGDWSSDVCSSDLMPSDNLSALPLEQQIGQLFFIGLPGTALDEQTGKLIEEVKPGGIIIFGRNVESPQQLRSEERRVGKECRYRCWTYEEGSVRGG